MHYFNNSLLISAILHIFILSLILNTSIFNKKKTIKDYPIKITVTSLISPEEKVYVKNKVFDKEIKKKELSTKVLSKEKIESKKKNSLKTVNKEEIKKEVKKQSKQKINEKKNLKKNPVKNKNIDTNKKENDASKNILIIDNKDDLKDFNSYKNSLRYLIQKEAIRNYPRKAIRKGITGIVELVFTLDNNGVLKEVEIGKNTKAANSLVKSSLKTLKVLSPFEKNDILKKRNKFTIKILYILN